MQYPLLQFKETNDRLSQYIVDLKDDQKFKFIHGLKVTSSETEFIEASTREQANNPAWFKHRKYRFTASLCNKIGDISPKTPKVLKTLAQNIFHGNEKKSVLQYKLVHGRHYEPTAIKHENYLRLSCYEVVVELCGFVIGKNNFVLGATPDGKVVGDGEFGLLCSEECKNIDPKDICFISKNPPFLYSETSCKILVNKSHTYYDQIQLQLALTTQSWCDFPFYTSKGLIIHRVQFDEAHWHKLQTKILNF